MKIFLIFFFFLNIQFFSFSQSVSKKMWVPDEIVTTMLVDGDFTYIGGRFHYVGPDNGSAALYQVNSNQPDTLFPKFNGYIYAAVADGSGGWYIAGDFTAVDSIARKYLVHINADRSIDSWNPNPDKGVSSLLINGSDLYVGGGFTTIAGIQRTYLAKFNINTGEINNSWNVNIIGSYNSIQSMALYQDSLIIAGYFRQISNQSRQNIAKVSCNDAALSDWNPFPVINSYFNIHTMCVKDSSLYIGGYFDSLNSHYIKNCAKINLNTGLDTSWKPNPNDRVSVIMPADHSVILGGYFDEISGEEVIALCKVNDSTAALDLTWKPLVKSTDYNFGISTLCKSGDDLYIGGLFTSVGEKNLYNLCRIDFNTAMVDTSFKFNTNKNVEVLEIYGNDLFAGGYFTSFGCERASSVAKLNNKTGKIVPNWGHNDISINGYSVDALALVGDYLYVGGGFTAGEDLENLIRIDAFTGALDTSWNMHVNDYVECLLNDGTDLYIGGFYTSIGGKYRSLLSRINLSSGTIDNNWNPNVTDPGGAPYVMTVDTLGDYIYIGGLFVKVGGQPRKCIAKISKSTGLADPDWKPLIQTGVLIPMVIKIVTDGDDIYAGGTFPIIDGQVRQGLARLNKTTGHVDSWNPGAQNGISTIAITSDAVYIGGGFDKIGNIPRTNVAKINKSNGSVYPWAPMLDGGVDIIKIVGNDVYVGGNFNSVNGISQPHLALFTDAISSVGELSSGGIPSEYNLYQNYPNPFNPSTIIKFTLPVQEKVTVKVFDVLGKELNTVVNNVLLAGEHQITFNARGLSSGVYFYRIESGAFVQTRKMIILK